MDNIVIRVAKEAGGLAKLADMHGVSYQAAWLWAAPAREAQGRLENAGRYPWLRFAQPADSPTAPRKAVWRGYAQSGFIGRGG